MHPNSLANLQKGKRFGSGQLTTLGGSSKGKRLSTWLREIGEQSITFKDLDGLPSDMPVKKAVAVSLIAKALSGDVQALKLVGSFYLADELETPPEQPIIDPVTRKMLESIGVIL
jgi:hypothetical protein